MAGLDILRREPPQIIHFDAALKEFLLDLRLAHWKRLEFTVKLDRQQHEIYSHLAELRRGNAYAKNINIDLIV